MLLGNNDVSKRSHNGDNGFWYAEKYFKGTKLWWCNTEQKNLDKNMGAKKMGGLLPIELLAAAAYKDW